LDTTTIILALFFLYWIIVAILNRKGVLEKYNISAYGPVLMIRTTKGLELLDRLAKPRGFWRTFANTGIILMFVGMLAMLLVVLLSDYAMLSSFFADSMPEPSKFNEARNVFLIPGVNEFIPLTWGIIALVVTLVVHEFSHAILCRVENIRVKSMGILLALVPIGGFAEPDDRELFGEEVKNEEGIYERISEPRANRNQRGRILAAGVMSNFAVALIAFALLFGPVLGAISPLGNAVIMEVTNGSSAQEADLEAGMVITGIDNIQVDNTSDLLSYTDTLADGGTVTLYAAKDRVVQPYVLTVGELSGEDRGGITVDSIVSGSPAEEAGLEAGMTILKIGGQPIETPAGFVSYMNNTTAGQEIILQIRPADGEDVLTCNVTLGEHPDNPGDKGFLGIFYSSSAIVETPLGISVGDYPAREYLDLLKSIPSMLTGVTGWVIILGLPIVGFTGEGFPGFSGILLQLYQPAGWAEPLGPGIFWMANSLLWVGWLNFYVGLFNCLPAVPLDGGHVFRDYLQAFLNRIFGDEEKAKTLSATIAAGFTMLILVSFAFMIFGPYMVHGF
jgi:membrane-associated protease RseP (regulator of RpoE activity)